MGYAMGVEPLPALPTVQPAVQPAVLPAGGYKTWCYTWGSVDVGEMNVVNSQRSGVKEGENRHDIAPETWIVRCRACDPHPADPAVTCQREMFIGME